jgi:hypothetical protein
MTSQDHKLLGERAIAIVQVRDDKGGGRERRI